MLSEKWLFSHAHASLSLSDTLKWLCTVFDFKLIIEIPKSRKTAATVPLVLHTVAKFASFFCTVIEFSM